MISPSLNLYLDRGLLALPGRFLLSTTCISHTYPPLEAEMPHIQQLACLAFCSISGPF